MLEEEEKRENEYDEEEHKVLELPNADASSFMIDTQQKIKLPKLDTIQEDNNRSILHSDSLPGSQRENNNSI